MSAPSFEVPPPHPYATNIPGRNPRFKTHKSLGHAKNAIVNKLNYNGVAQCDITVFKLEDGKYKHWFTIARGQRRSEVPELAPKSRRKADIRLDIRELVRQERDLRQRADEVAALRRELEAAL